MMEKLINIAVKWNQLKELGLEEEVYIPPPGPEAPAYGAIDLEYPSKPLIDPYLMGLLLGDGCMGPLKLRIAAGKQDAEHVLRAFRSKGYGMARDGPCQFAVSQEGLRKHPNHIRNQLRRHGLWGLRSRNKHLPVNWAAWGARHRLWLLQGLMDSDGHVDLRGYPRYTSISNDLAEGVADLARSLGYTAKVTTRTPIRKIDPTYLAYVVYINADNKAGLFRLERKKERCKKGSKWQKAKVKDLMPTEQSQETL
jgi:hypothetical protein